jgi:hypothetical protein
MSFRIRGLIIATLQELEHFSLFPTLDIHYTFLFESLNTLQRPASVHKKSWALTLAVKRQLLDPLSPVLFTSLVILVSLSFCYRLVTNSFICHYSYQMSYIAQRGDTTPPAVSFHSYTTMTRRAPYIFHIKVIISHGTDRIDLQNAGYAILSLGHVPLLLYKASKFQEVSAISWMFSMIICHIMTVLGSLGDVETIRIPGISSALL